MRLRTERPCLAESELPERKRSIWKCKAPSQGSRHSATEPPNQKLKIGLKIWPKAGFLSPSQPSYFPAMLLLYIVALWFAQGATEESCEVAQLLQTWQKPGVTINGTEAEAVTSCAKKGCEGGCWFGLLKYAKDYECVYVDWFPLHKVEVFYCHDGKLLKCGSKPDATCYDFEAPNPCNPTSTSATTVTSAGSTATTTATTTLRPTSTSATTITSAGTTATTTATTTGLPSDLMIWMTNRSGTPICLTGSVMPKPVKGLVNGLPCDDRPTQLWEYTNKGEIVFHMNQLCLTAIEHKEVSEVYLTECDGSEWQSWDAKTDSWTSIRLESQSKCLLWVGRELPIIKSIWLLPCPSTEKPMWKSVPKRQHGLDDPVK